MAEQRARNSGFTLLELLVALAIFGLVIVALTSGVRFAARAAQAVERQNSSDGDLAPVQSAIRRILGEGRSIEGLPDRVSFVGTMPDAFDLPGVYEMTLALAGDRLVLRWRPHAAKNGGDEPAEESEGSRGEAELARGIADLAFEYRLPSKDGGSGWQPESKDHDVTPLLVRLTVKLPPQDRRRWPDLVVAPAVDTAPPTATG